MPLIQVLGTGLLAAALLAFNPLGRFIQNPMIAGIAMAVFGAIIFMVLGKKAGKFGSILKLVGGSMVLAGIITSVAPLIRGIGGKVVTQTA